VFAPSAQIALSPGVAAPGLANVAATVLQLLGLAAPEGYAPSLLAGD
jgi:2,3-bisphosphoglycerate-independent phosphoglycerate mutase